MSGIDTSDRRRGGERGFTLTELLIVLVIISILAAIAMAAVHSARVSSRISATQAAAASIDQAVGSFNRIYPRVGGTDPLLSRGGGAMWKSQGGDPSLGLADETGEWLLSSWPDNPYTSGGVRVYRGTASPCTRSGAMPGDIMVCRNDATRAARYEIVAWAQGSNGTTKEVYRVAH